ncbi:hypothetical protein BGX28_003614 [Mortierella sp. GBA30]|nr:hypothetical protein BGX28_003614 [Mortierella sp. GBA30]
MSTELLIQALRDLKDANVVNNSRNQDLEAIAKRLQADSEFRYIQHMISRGRGLGEPKPSQLTRQSFGRRVICRRSANLPQLIQEVVSQAAHTHYGNTAYIMLLRAGVQALANLLTGNEISKDSIWRSLLLQSPSSSCDQYLLSTLVAIEDETVVISTVMLCYNCVFDSKERSALLFASKAGRKLLVRLINESHATSTKEERKSFEMIYTFFNHLISLDLFQDIFKALKSEDSAEDKEEYSIQYHGENFHKKDDGDTLPKIQELRVEELEDEENSSASEERSEDKRTTQSYLSTEQVILLKMLDSRIYTHHERLQEQYQERHQSQVRSTVATQDDRNTDDLFTVDETKPAISLETVRYLSHVFDHVSALTIDILGTLDQPGVGKHGVEDLANVSSGLMLLLGCFSHLSLHEDAPVTGARSSRENLNGGLNSDNENDVEVELGHLEEPLRLPDWFKAQHMAMVSGGVVENAIDLLRQADKSLARVTKPATAMPTAVNGPPLRPAGEQAVSSGAKSMSANSESTLLSNTSTVHGQQSFFVGLKRDIVRLVGNLAYRSRHVQDRIRHCNGLIVMLSQCNIDDANPYLREYAILAMKNILAGNPENQALIEELQPIEAVDHPALQEARVTAHLDAKTGRPVLTQQRA